LYEGRHFGVDFQSDTDHAAIARGFGLIGVQVEDPTAVDRVLGEALDSDRPTFVDITTECEATELPPVVKFHRARHDAGG
jgi:thiamine pyrophosphate-dependent acetolactate synthase large subunit-like protein